MESVEGAYIGNVMSGQIFSPQRLERIWQELSTAARICARPLKGCAVHEFSREYCRLFGAPPQRDIRRMRLNQISPR